MEKKIRRHMFLFSWKSLGEAYRYQHLLSLMEWLEPGGDTLKRIKLLMRDLFFSVLLEVFLFG